MFVQRDKKTGEIALILHIEQVSSEAQETVNNSCQKTEMCGSDWLIEKPIHSLLI